MSKKPHWSIECKTIKEERDRLLAELNKQNASPEYSKLLKEIYDIAGGYYATFDEIREKIVKSGLMK